MASLQQQQGMSDANAGAHISSAKAQPKHVHFVQSFLPQGRGARLQGVPVAVDSLHLQEVSMALQCWHASGLRSAAKAEAA